MITIAALALGGALGAVSRYGVGAASVMLFGHGFPVGTMLVNVLGSFVMGVLVSVFAHMGQPDLWVQRLALTGFLGAFTTFSTFSLDSIALLERGDFGAAALYIGGSVLLSLGALFAGMLLVRGIVS